MAAVDVRHPAAILRDVAVEGDVSQLGAALGIVNSAAIIGIIRAKGYAD